MDILYKNIYVLLCIMSIDKHDQWVYNKYIR